MFAHEQFRKCNRRCFLRAQTGKHLLWKQNVSEKNQKTVCFFLVVSNKCFRSKYFACAQTGKHLGKHISGTIFSRLVVNEFDPCLDATSARSCSNLPL